MRKRALLVVAGLALLGFAPAPFHKPDRQRDDPTDVSGTWEFVRSESAGRVDPPSDEEYVLEMTKDRCVFVNLRTGRDPYEMRLDTAASPPSFTWGHNGNVAYVGIYRREKDQLTMDFAISSQSGDRPVSFNQTPPFRYVLRRVGRK